MPKRVALEQEERLRRRQWLILSVVGGVLLVAFVYGSYWYFNGQTVLLPGEHLETVVTQAVSDGARQADNVDCPFRDLKRGDRVICAVHFTDGSTARISFGVRGRRGSITPIVRPA